MNTKLSIIDSIYDIEDSMCESSLDTISSMIEASDKAYSIIKECSSYGDEVYDMFAIFQEADDNMDPDQHGKKIADMNDKEKAAYREKHAFKEDSAFMTFLKFIPNLFGLIVRSIKKLFTKKPDQNAVQKAINTIQNWSENHQELAKEALSQLYEAVLGEKPTDKMTILGITIPVSMLVGAGGVMLVGGTKVLTDCKERIQGLFNKIFKHGGAPKIKFGLKLKFDENKKVYWASDINFKNLEDYAEKIETFSKAFNKVASKENVANNDIGTSIEAIKKAKTELDSDNIKKSLINDKAEDVGISSSDLLVEIDGIMNKLKATSNNLEAAISSFAKDEKEMSEDDQKKIGEANVIKDAQYLSEITSSLVSALDGMINHINAMTKDLSEGNFIDKLISKLKEAANGNDTLLGKLASFLGGKRLAATDQDRQKHSDAKSNEPANSFETKTITADDGKQYDTVDVTEGVLNNRTSNDYEYAVDLGADGYDIQSKTGLTWLNDNMTLDEFKDNLKTNNLIVVTSHKEAPAPAAEHVEADEQVTDEAQQKPEDIQVETQSESFVDNTDDDVINEQVSSRWYSL